MKILITGAKGQLAREFQRLLELYPHEVSALDRESLDIANDSDVEKTFAVHTPDIVLNCAAYNLVDRAEADYDSAFAVNSSGVKNLAVACKKVNALLVHFSAIMSNDLDGSTAIARVDARRRWQESSG